MKTKRFKHGSHAHVRPANTQHNDGIDGTTQPRGALLNLCDQTVGPVSFHVLQQLLWPVHKTGIQWLFGFCFERPVSKGLRITENRFPSCQQFSRSLRKSRVRLTLRQRSSSSLLDSPVL